MDPPPRPPSPPPPPSQETDVAFGLLLLMLGLVACVYVSIVVRREIRRQPNQSPNYASSDGVGNDGQTERILAKIPPTELIALSASGFPTPRHLYQFQKGVA
jgi:hypothetical protein